MKEEDNLRTGRPLTRDIDFELLKLMVKKGFTLEETSEYFNCPYQTIQYYVRKRKYGWFARYLKGRNDDLIIQLLEVEHKTQSEAEQILGIKQCNISKRYNKLKKFRALKEERYKWLTKWESAKGVERN